MSFKQPMLRDETQRYVAATIEALGVDERTVLKEWLRGESLTSCPRWLESYLRELAWDNQMLRNGLRAGIILIRGWLGHLVLEDAPEHREGRMWVNYAAGLGERKRPK